MAPLRPISHADLIRNLKSLGFEGPYSGGKHLYVMREGRKHAIPNPHKGDIDPSFVARLLRQLDIPKDIWTDL
jgi:predicted RNA binding protein YcfA (HicA-like mRNA interferase family)